MTDFNFKRTPLTDEMVIKGERFTKVAKTRNWTSTAIVGNGKTETETSTIALKSSSRWERIDIIPVLNSSGSMACASPRTTVTSKKRLSGI